MKRKNKLLLYTMVVAAAVTGIALALSLISNNSTSSILEPKSKPVLLDDRLAVDVVAEGLDHPTSMRFLENNTLVILEKNKGQVRIISDGRLLEEPIIQLDVVAGAEQGLLGIAIWNSKKNDSTSSLFLYLTEDYEGKTRNAVYKYDYDEKRKTLENKTIVLELPGEPGPFHNGGQIAVGPSDGNLYVVIGDVSSGGSLLDNQIQGRRPNDKSVIFRVDRDNGAPAADNPFHNYNGEMEKLQRYYAYGIRNSFGMAFDPITGKLWITENGNDTYDEIDIVEPGFNSGWHKLMGPIGRTNLTVENDLVTFDGASYADPVFSWYTPVGVTDIEFFNSTKLGNKYHDNIFVGDINNGNLYFLEVNRERTGFTLHDPRLLDLVADPAEEEEKSEISSLIFGEDFGGITDIETGPDGLLYLLTYEDGKIYRITEKIS